MIGKTLKTLSLLNIINCRQFRTVQKLFNPQKKDSCENKFAVFKRQFIFVFF